MATIHPCSVRSSILIAVHGIFRKQTWPGWPDATVHAASKRRPDITVIPEIYSSWLSPRLMHLIVNPRATRGLVRRAMLYSDNLPVDLVAHSNGALIVLGASEELLKAGRRVRTITLIAGACPSDIAKLTQKYPRTFGPDGPDIEAWSSASDYWTSSWLWPFGAVRWPWGNLGGAGFDPQRSARHRTVWFPLAGHSGYFHASARDATITRILSRIPTPPACP